MKKPFTSHCGRSRALPALSLTMISIIGLQSSAFAQGSLTPPGAPAPTMKTLDQVQPRAPLSGQTFINNPGSYYLTTNVICNGGGYGFIIQTNNVSIDLNGFSLIGIPNSSAGILVNGSYTNVTICNGTVRDWHGAGIDASQCNGGRFEKLKMFNNNGDGLSCADNSLIDHCLATLNKGSGFVSGPNCAFVSCIATGNSNANGGFHLGADCTASHCAANNNFSYGFSAGDRAVFSECNATSNGFEGFDLGRASKLTGCVAGFNYGLGRGFFVSDGSVLRDCTAISNTGDGIVGGHGCVLSGCVGRLNGGNGFSLDYGTVVTGCSAVENTGIGIWAGGAGILVKDCDAHSNTGDGIRAGISCQILNNICTVNGTFASNNAAGIHVTDYNNRIEGNSLTLNHNFGLQVDFTNGANLIIRNSSINNYGSSYVIAPGNKDAQILPVTSGFTNANPWANIQ